MLKWLAERTYNRFDPIWLALAVLAIRDHEWAALIVFVIAGALISACIEWLADRAA